MLDRAQAESVGQTIGWHGWLMGFRRLNHAMTRVCVAHRSMPQLSN